MAAKNKKRSPRKKSKAPKRAPKQKPYGKQDFDPLAQPYETNADFERGVRQTASGEYQPQLNALRNQGREETRRHTGRQSDIKQDYDFYGGELEDSFNETRGALNDLIASHHASNEAGLQTITAALNRPTPDQAAITGGVPTAPVDDNSQEDTLLAGALAGSGDTALTANFGNIISHAGRDRGLAGLGRARSSETEAGRFAGEMNDIRAKKQDIQARIPSILTATRNNLLQQARQGQNQAFTQRLSEKQFGLSASNQAFTQDLASKQLGLEKRKQKEVERVNTANIYYNQGQLAQHQQEIDNAAANAVGTGDEEHAKARAEAFQKGGEFLDSYLTAPKGTYIGAPPKGKKGKNLREYTPLAGHAYRVLRTRYGLSRRDAIKIIRTGQLPEFRNYDGPGLSRRDTKGRDVGAGLGLGGKKKSKGQKAFESAPPLKPRRKLRKSGKS